MEIVLGFIVIVIIVAVMGAGTSTTPTRPSPQPTPRPGPPAWRPTAAEAARHRDIERERLADEAFFDGVVFGHYFLDDLYAEDDDDVRGQAFDDEFDEDYDDGMFDR